MLGQNGPEERVPARVGELEADQEVIALADRFGDGPKGVVRSITSSRRCGRLGDDELAGIGPTLGHDRGGLAPDQLGAPRAEATVSAERQLARRAVELAVATLHGLDRQPIADASATDGDRTEQGSEVVTQGDIQAHRPNIGPEAFARFVLEISRHGSGSPPFFLPGPPPWWQVDRERTRSDPSGALRPVAMSRNPPAAPLDGVSCALLD